jgi:hypothetical protein
LCCGKSREQRGINARVTLFAPEPARFTPTVSRFTGRLVA